MTCAILKHMSIAIDTPRKTEQSALNLWRISVERFQDWIERGVITENDNVELIEGKIVGKEVVNPPHATMTELVIEMLRENVGKGHFIGSQRPIVLKDSQPEPDVMLIAGKIRDYRHSHPTPQQVPLVVEVSDSTLDYDRSVKQRIYARSNVQTYWIVNLPERKVEVYTKPDIQADEALYLRLALYIGDDSVPIIIDGLEVGRISLSDLFD